MYHEIQNSGEKTLMLQIIKKFLKKYSTHSQLDPIEVIKDIPDEWCLNDENAEESPLFFFLSSALSKYSFERKNKKCHRKMSEIHY